VFEFTTITISLNQRRRTAYKAVFDVGLYFTARLPYRNSVELTLTEADHRMNVTFNNVR